MKILILNHQEIETLLPMPTCISLMRDALAALARGEVFQPLRTVVRPPQIDGLMGLMPAYIHGPHPALGLKAICVFHNNPELGKDAHQGSVMLFSAETGELQGLMNASAITGLRTAAVSGVATQLLANEEAGDLAIVGAGVQARAHLAAMAAVRPIKRVRVASRQPENAARFAAEMQPQYDFPIESANDVQAVVQHADIIVTVTSSAEPVLQRDWISPGAHLNVVGSSVPIAREVDTATMVAARLFVDRRESTLNEAGDYLFAMKEGAISPDHIQAELGEILIGAAAGRQTKSEITLFKSLGLALEDVASAAYLYQQAQATETGTWVSF